MSSMGSEHMRIAIQRSSQVSGVFAGAGMMGGRQGVPLSLPLPFLLTGISAAALFAVLLPWIIPEALITPAFPHVLMLVHLVTLGWLTMTMMGASLQLVPVIIASPLRATRFLCWQYPLYGTGVVLLLAGFWWMLPWLMITGGTLVVLAVVHYIAVLAITFARTEARPLTVRYLIAALVYLGIVVSLGLTAALDFQFVFLGAGFNRLLLTHITLGVAGWLTSMLIGVSYTLVRLFALAHGHDDSIGRVVFWLLNGGIIGLALGFSLDWLPLIIAGGLLLSIAAWLFGYDYWRMLRVRHRKVLDATQYHAIASVVYLLLVVPAGIVAALAGWNQPAVLVALVLAALVGWLGQSVIGYLYKIVPFLIWQERYGALVGKQKVPLMREMLHERWTWAGWWLINGGLVAVMLALLLSPWTWPVQLAGLALAGGCVLALLNIAGVVRHLKKRAG
ncbi:MAG: hypothetical protein IMW89_19510 [Ktedonobacteraceae bacterium]|nr:hypothetical protein [Ktedonobacteraceae bacterium]